jgi:hypothetical protein
MQIKTTLRYTFGRVTKAKKTVTGVDKDVEKFKSSHISDGIIKWCGHIGK